MEPVNCNHKSFEASVHVDRICDPAPGTDRPDEDSMPNAFYANVTITCADCKAPFRFVGVPGGLSPRRPMCDPLATELRAPIAPGALSEPIAHSLYELAPEADVTTDMEQ